MEADIKVRVAWIDIAKAITILLVIIGHSVSGILCGVIYSFHMVLFFFLSAWTSKKPKTKEELDRKLKRSASQLLKPAAIAFALNFIFSTICGLVKNTFGGGYSYSDFVKDKALSLLFCSGNSTTFLGIDIPGIGVIWFLVVLFVGRVIYDWLLYLVNDDWKCLLLLTALASTIGVAVGRRQFLFISFDIALAVLVLFTIAQILKSWYIVEEHSFRKMVICFGIWVIAIALPIAFNPSGGSPHLNLAGRVYPLFPICYVGAVAGTLFVSQVSYFFARMDRKIVCSLCFLGRNSLFMMIVHYFDHYWSFFYSFSTNMYVKALFRVTIDLIIFGLFIHVKNGFYKIKNEKGNT